MGGEGGVVREMFLAVIVAYTSAYHLMMILVIVEVLAWILALGEPPHPLFPGQCQDQAGLLEHPGICLRQLPCDKLEIKCKDLWDT